jgi:antitoxin component of RelBE/YafQ-DinJ toxin-antitoxin module
MPKARKSAHVSVRLTPDLQAWLYEEAEHHGLDPSAYVRMVLHRLRREGTIDTAAEITRLLST